MGRKAIRVYYQSDSHDELIMEFLDEQARKRGQTRKDLILEILRIYCLPVALKQSGLGDSFELDSLGRTSVGALNSQLGLIINQLGLKNIPNIQFSDSKPQVEAPLTEKNEDEDPIDISKRFRSLSI